MTLAALLGLACWSTRLPDPLGADAPAQSFAEGRARPVVDHLAGVIGHRVIGTPGRDAAMTYLVDRLQALPGVEVLVQDTLVSRAHPAWDYVVRYRARNVLARIRGDSSGAVLVSAHYDSPGFSVGAADNAASVAIALEVARALAAGPRLRHSVVFNFNDGEEAGLLGVLASAQHPWLAEVRAFVNLDGAGSGGRSTLFQTGPGNPWLAEAYARAAPYPTGTVVGQDVFQSGAIPSETDFRIYRDVGGLRGLDIATIEDGYAYHTALDRPERLEPGTLQQGGANALAVVHELASHPLPTEVSSRSSVYYDVLGNSMLAYSSTTARRLAGLALGAALLALGYAWTRSRLGIGGLMAGVAVWIIGAALGLALPVAAALGLHYVFHRPHGWFSAPWLAFWAFAPWALAGVVATHGAWAWMSSKRGTPAGRRSSSALAGCTLMWAVALAWLTHLGLGSSYLALWWCGTSAAALLLVTRWPEAGAVGLPALLLPAGALSAEIGVWLVLTFVPIAGRMPLPFPFDPVVAGLVALPLTAVALTGAAGLHPARHSGRVVFGLVLLGLAGLLATATHFPYTAERPKRLWLEAFDDGERQGLRFRNWDFVPLTRAVAGWPGAVPSGRDYIALDSSASVTMDTSRLVPPTLWLSAVGKRSGSKVREVLLQVGAGPFSMVDLILPRPRLQGWSLASSWPDSPDPHRVKARIFAPGDSAWSVRLRLRGDEPVELTVIAYSDERVPARARRAMARLPEWLTVYPYASVERRLKI